MQQATPGPKAGCATATPAHPGAPFPRAWVFFPTSHRGSAVSSSTETIHVAGAGIGGLATAVALQQQGVPVVVHDRASELTPVGAGISVWPNAVLALESLGVSGLRGGSIPRGGAGLYRWDGEPLATNAGEAIERRYGAPLVLLHRAELQQALLRALAPRIGPARRNPRLIRAG